MVFKDWTFALATSLLLFVTSLFIVPSIFGIMVAVWFYIEALKLFAKRGVVG